MHPSFGKGIDWTEHIFHALSTFPKAPATDARLWLLHRYETDYGIYNHDIDKKPLSIEMSGQHWSEEYSLSVGYSDRLREFVELKVGKHFNVGLTEFLSYPRDLIEEILKICGERERVGETAAEGLQSELDKLGNM